MQNALPVMPSPVFSYWYVLDNQFPKLHLSAKLGKLLGSVCASPTFPWWYVWMNDFETAQLGGLLGSVWLSPVGEYKGGAASEGSRTAVALCGLVQLGFIEPSQPLGLFIIKLEA